MSDDSTSGRRMIQGPDCVYPCPSKESVQAVIDAYNHLSHNYSHDSEVIVSEALWQCWEETDRKSWMFEVAALWFGWWYCKDKDDVYTIMYEVCVKHTDLSATQVKRRLIDDILDGKYS